MKQVILTNEELGAVCLALAHLLHAGVSAGDALTLLETDEKNPSCRQLLHAMAAGADEGQSLSEVFRVSGCAPAYVCTLLAVGEKTGKLETTLEALSRYYRELASLERQLRSSLMYPAAVLAVLLAVLAALLIWVLPVFDQVYAQLGSGLTGVAGGLLAAGRFLKRCLPVIAAVLAFLGAAAAIPVVRKSCLGFWRKHWADRGVFGKVNTARFIQALSLCVSSGMAAVDAAELSASLAEDPAFRRRCETFQKQVGSGKKLSAALREVKLLPPAECRLLDAGERSGQSEAVLEDISLRLLEHSQEALQQAAGKAEPAMVAAACVLIGLVLLAVMLPLVDIMSAIG